MRRLLARLPIPLWCIALLVLLPMLMWQLQYVWLPGALIIEETSDHRVTEIEPVTSVQINEVMSSNRAAWAGAEGRYPDWVELKNTGAREVDITGWTLTNRVNRVDMFTFPEHTLMPGEFVLVSFTGVLKNQPGGDYQAPMRLSAGGDAIMLYDARGDIAQAVNIPPLGRHQVYARDPERGEWRVTDAYTPGLDNTEENHRLLTDTSAASDSPVVIQAICADNDGSLSDVDGDASDWIELFNTGGAPVNLDGYMLSDSEDNPQRWRFPDVTLESGARIVVFASGKDAVKPNGELHTNFKLNAEGETVVLTDAQGRRVQAATYELLGPGAVHTPDR